MSTIYYIACMDCCSLVSLGKYYLVPSLDEYFNIAEDITDAKLHANEYAESTILLLTFLLHHQAHRIVLANEDGMDEIIEGNWYKEYKRELQR